MNKEKRKCIIIIFAIFIILLTLLVLPYFTTQKEILKTSINTELKSHDSRVKIEYESLKSKKYFEIYLHEGKYNVWKIKGLLLGFVQSYDTVEEAKKYIDDYYIQWAENIIGKEPEGEKIEF